MSDSGFEHRTNPTKLLTIQLFLLLLLLCKFFICWNLGWIKKSWCILPDFQISLDFHQMSKYIFNILISLHCLKHVYKNALTGSLSWPQIHPIEHICNPICIGVQICLIEWFNSGILLHLPQEHFPQSVADGIILWEKRTVHWEVRISNRNLFTLCVSCYSSSLNIVWQLSGSHSIVITVVLYNGGLLELCVSWLH